MVAPDIRMCNDTLAHMVRYLSPKDLCQLNQTEKRHAYDLLELGFVAMRLEYKEIAKIGKDEEVTTWSENLQLRSQQVENLLKYIPRVCAYLKATSGTNRNEELSVLYIKLLVNLYGWFSLDLVRHVQSISKWFEQIIEDRHNITPDVIDILIDTMEQATRSIDLDEMTGEMYRLLIQLGKAKVLEYEQKFDQNTRLIVRRARQLFFDE